MKFVKYFAGSLIISFGVLLVAGMLLRAVQVELPEEVARYGLLIWVSLAVVISPFARKIIRV